MPKRRVLCIQSGQWERTLTPEGTGGVRGLESESSCYSAGARTDTENPV